MLIVNVNDAVELIKNFIDNSKLTFLSSAGNVKIINENLGLWENGLWYSNTGFKPYIPQFQYYFNQKNFWKNEEEETDESEELNFERIAL